jgi:hypothetical protein
MHSAVARPYLQSLPMPERPRPRAGLLLPEPLRDSFNIIVSGCISLLIFCAFVVVYDQPLHWCLVPILACGCLSGIDMTAYLRGKLDAFDPLGVVGLFSYHFFFLAPLLTLLSGYHSKFLPAVPDWNDWIGWMAVINVASLLVYLGSRRIFPVRKPSTAWLVRPASFFMAISIALPITLALQIFVFVKFGGITGFMETFSNKDGAVFSGMGYIFLIAETFPMFLAIAILVWKRDFLRQSPWAIIAVFMATFVALKLICGGLRGSRTITVFGIFWIVGAIHVWIRPVPRKFLAIGVLVIIAFMYLYGFYKDVGIGAFDAVQDSSKIGRLEDNSGRTIYEVLLGDLGRTEIQATLLNRVSTSGDFQYSYGKTYLEAFAFMIPKYLWADRPEGKVTAGTEALFGRGSYDPVLHRATYIYGLAGEAMLNFPPAFVPLAFVVLAFVISKLRSLLLANGADLRLLLVPVCAYAATVFMGSDLDNVLFASLSIAIAPLILIRCCCTRVKVQ